MRKFLLIYLLIFCIINLFVLVPAVSAAKVSGFLFYRDGETAVKNGTIFLIDNEGNEYPSGYTDDTGYYMIDSVPPGEFDIRVRVKSFTRSHTVDETTEASSYYVQGRLIIGEEAVLIDLNLLLNTSPAGIFFLSPVGIALITGVTGATVYVALEILDDDDDEASPSTP